MSNISDIFNDTSHRPFALPAGGWTYYQEWNDALFLHWKIPFGNLRRVVPRNFTIDTINGDCYVSLVAFTMLKIRPRYFPSISFVSNFNEINLRTYIINDNKPGVYFLNIEGAKSLSVFASKFLSGLPYEKAVIKRTDKAYTSRNIKKSFHLDTEFIVKEKFQRKSNLDKWLTERYCLYLDTKGKCYRYDIHHKEWQIKKVDITQLKLHYRIGDIDLSVRKPDLVLYSDGVKVIAWNRQRI